MHRVNSIQKGCEDMKDNKPLILGSILSAGALVLLKATKCIGCSVRTKPWLTYIVNPCEICRVHGRRYSPPESHGK